LPLHNTLQYLEGTRILGVHDAGNHLSVGRSKDADIFANSLFSKFGRRSGGLVVALAPFSTEENKDWSTSRYVALAEWLIEKYNALIVITAGTSDSLRANSYFERLPDSSAIITHNTKVAQHIAILRRCTLVISGDSSPMHIAAALDIPYIALFCPIANDVLVPLEGQGKVVRKRISCAPCGSYRCTNSEFRKCMTLIDIRDVQSALIELLGEPLEASHASRSLQA
jgi:ADP-heptose:LPS heptosyltransferase